MNPFERLSKKIIIDDGTNKAEATERGITAASDLLISMNKLKLPEKALKCILNCSCDGNYGEFKNNILNLHSIEARICEDCGYEWKALEPAAYDICHKAGCNTIGKKYCSGCYTRKYCSQSCQKADWSAGGHKKQCAEYRAKILHALENEGTLQDENLYVRDIISERGIELFSRKFIM
jgi:hypothetical protein